MGMDGRTKTLATATNSSLLSAKDPKSEQTLEPDIHKECSQSCTSLYCEGTDESGAGTSFNINYSSNKSVEPAEQREDDQSERGNRQDQYSMENDIQKPEDQQQSVKCLQHFLDFDSQEHCDPSDRAHSICQKRSGPGSCEGEGGSKQCSHEVQQRNESEYNGSNQECNAQSCQEDTELSISVPSMLGVDLCVSPASLYFQGKEHLTELHSLCTKMGAKGIEPGKQEHRNFMSKWRSVSEKHMKKLQLCDASELESQLSGRIKIQVIGKSKSLPAGYNERLELAPLITTITAEPEVEEDIFQACSRDGNIKNWEHTLRIKDTQEKEDNNMTGNEDNETEQRKAAVMCEDSQEQGSLNDLTISLLEATGSLIGRLSSLKEKLGRSQPPDSFSTYKELEQNVQVTPEHRYDVKTTDTTQVSQVKITAFNGTKDNINKDGTVTAMSKKEPDGDQLEHDGECIKNKGRSKTLEKQVVGCECMGKITTDVDYIAIETQGGCETESKQNKEKEEKNYFITGNVINIQHDTLSQGEHCHMQEDALTEVSAASAEGMQKLDVIDPVHLQSKKETQIFKEQVYPAIQINFGDRGSQISSSTQRLRPNEDGRNSSDDNAEEYNTVYHSNGEEICSVESASKLVPSEYNLCEIYNFKLGPEKREQFANVYIEGQRQNEQEPHREVDNLVGKKKVEQTEGTEMEEIENVRKYIRKGVVKRKRLDTEEREMEKQSKEDEYQSDQELMKTDSQDECSGYGELTCRGNGERMELDDIKMGHKQLSGSDDGLVKNKESLLSVEVAEIYRRYEGDILQKGSMKEIRVAGEIQINQENLKEILGEEGLDTQVGKEQNMESCPWPESGMACGVGGESQQSIAINQQAPGPWFKFWGTANQTVTVAAAGTCMNDNFLNHMAQVPANGILMRNEAQLLCPLHSHEQPQTEPRPSALQDEAHDETRVQPCEATVPRICSVSPGQSALQREKVFIRLSVKEQQEAMQRLTDLQREAELKCASDRRRQMLRFQERLSIARNRKSEVDLMDITQRRSPQRSPEPLPEGDAERQKSAVKEHLERMKRERTYLMQTRRDRNTSSFRELLDPVLTRNKREDSGPELRGAEGP